MKRATSVSASQPALDIRINRRFTQILDTRQAEKLARVMHHTKPDPQQKVVIAYKEEWRFGPRPESRKAGIAVH
ncbi:hypothetical protein BT96DRAFT_1010274 [Gymnopus androsaceus JB14]|uniref:Uncharacterized protein n=1 Tax=Gymnopus androsaceus JB14 TaxID=1447944 RepID=A0A6A4GAZ5_9AGAR|nr:hypothetical protein BT96DRAFT_1010274 [Gymnopus androsaceus JB14]